VRLRRYRGAGIVFVCMEAGVPAILLAQRRRSGVWSIPGGGAERRDGGDFWRTALRETEEEFGRLPGPTPAPWFAQRFPFGWLGFSWTTYVVRLGERPEGFPNRNARDFTHEFRDAAWFPIDRLPPKCHWLLWPVVWRLRGRGKKWEVRS